MSSHIYLTKHQIHEMFIDQQQNLVSPSFMEPTSPQSKEKRYFFHQETNSPSKKDDKSTDNQSNRKGSQESIFDSKIEMKLTHNQICLSNISELQSINKDKETIVKLQQQLNQQANFILNLQNQIITLKDLNKKYQNNISELLAQIRKLEQESQYYQDQLLKNRLTLQDSIKQQQQFKIDMENTKIQLINKDQMIESLTTQLKTFRQETNKSRIGQSPNRIVEPIVNKHHPSISYINYRITPQQPQRSHSSNMKNF